MVWLSLGRRSTWLGLGKDYVLAFLVLLSLTQLENVLTTCSEYCFWMQNVLKCCLPHKKRDFLITANTIGRCADISLSISSGFMHLNVLCGFIMNAITCQSPEKVISAALMPFNK